MTQDLSYGDKVKILVDVKEGRIEGFNSNEGTVKVSVIVKEDQIEKIINPKLQEE